MSTTPTEPLLVRVDPDTRNMLKSVADSSDRTMSQLVRYATVWWTSDPDRARPVVGLASSADLSEFINVRFSLPDMTLVREVSQEMGLKPGAVVRCAVRAWLAAGDFGALGDPRRAAPGEGQVAV